MDAVAEAVRGKRGRVMTIWYIILALIVCVWFMGVVCLFTEGDIFGGIFHRCMSWHFPDYNKPQSFDGLSMGARCRFCGKPILMDSQGNWFVFEIGGGDE